MVLENSSEKLKHREPWQRLGHRYIRDSAIDTYLHIAAEITDIICFTCLKVSLS